MVLLLVYIRLYCLQVEYGNNDKRTEEFVTGFTTTNGAYIELTVRNGRVAGVIRLTELRSVPNSAWSGSTAVTVGGRTYRVSADVPCYNKDTGTWMPLSEAHAYASASNLYVKDGTVRVIEVRHG